MCIIIHKPKGHTVSRDTLKRCFDKNSDGAGFMWNSDNSIWGNKGYMSLKALLKGLEDAGFYDPTTKQVTEDYAVTIHFRWASHGKVCPANCHPFPVCDDYDLLKSRYWEADVGIAHNGVIPIKLDEGVSDTMTWIKQVFSSPVVYQNMNDPAINKLVAGSINGSRLAIIYATGEVVLVGGWVKEDGVYYSNTGFRGDVSQTVSATAPVRRTVVGAVPAKKEGNKMVNGRLLPPPGMKWAK